MIPVSIFNRKWLDKGFTSKDAKSSQLCYCYTESIISGLFWSLKLPQTPY